MINTPIHTIQQQAVNLLKNLISTPSISREEEFTATLIQHFFEENNIPVQRHLNNVWIRNKYYNEKKATLLLNSHHDTVRPNKGYTRDPYLASVEEGKLFGLGSNDAGGALVALIAAFLHFYDEQDLQYNLVLAATAEEEISGRNGIEALLPLMGKIDCGIVGEPTKMEMAIAERGLIVLDCLAEGRAGHAAREEGENAIYKAMMDIEWLYVYKFPKISDLLGPVKMTVTSIETENKAHNVIPSQCSFIVDVRVNELYSLEEVVETIKENLQSKVQPRSLRMRSTSISINHPLVRSGIDLGRSYYGSPTTSDKALMPFPTLKMGPGDSARSHTANEFIYIDEINEGIDLYIKLLNRVMK